MHNQTSLDVWSVICGGALTTPGNLLEMWTPRPPPQINATRLQRSQSSLRNLCLEQKFSAVAYLENDLAKLRRHSDAWRPWRLYHLIGSEKTLVIFNAPQAGLIGMQNGRPVIQSLYEIIKRHAASAPIISLSLCTEVREGNNSGSGAWLYSN